MFSPLRLAGAPSRVRVCLEVHIAAAPVGDVRVALGRAEIRVAEHLLHRAEVGAALEKMRRERVAEEVRMDTARLEAGAVGEFLEDEERAGAGERTAARVEEELRPVAAVEMRAAEGEIAAHGLGGGTAERDEALLAALSEHADDALVDGDAALLEPDGLGHAKPGAVQELDERTVAKRSRAWCPSRRRSGARSRPARAREGVCDRDAVAELRQRDSRRRTPIRTRWRKYARTAETRRAIVEPARPSARIEATQRSRSSTVASATGAIEERAERGQVASIGVDGPRRPPSLQAEQEAFDVGVGGTHGARPDSPGARRLLSGAILRRLPVRVAAAVAITVASFAAVPSVASASQLIARNTSSESIAVSSTGKAVLTYHAKGRLQRVLVWGALNARTPSMAGAPTEFEVDYSGGWGSHGRAVWKTLRNTCGAYTGPPLQYLVAACTARDGSHWAVQRWQRHQANFGLAPWKPGHGARELRLSHWRGELPKLEVWLDWSYGGQWHHLFGRLTYRGLPVHGFSTTPSGDPLDRFGRVLYLDTLDSAYGQGWRRENGFVSRNPDGTFCYGFVPHTAHTGERRPAGHGRRYRLAVSGPGVTPDVVWEGDGLPAFNRSNKSHVAHETSMNAHQRTLAAGSKPCHP